MSYARVHELQLPTIEELIGLGEPDDREEDWTRETRVQTTGSVRRIPTPSAIVRAAVRPRAEVVDFAQLTSAPLRVSAPTVLTVRTRAKRALLWPVFLCGLFAGVFGGVAFFKSPMGKKPAVQHVVKQLHSLTR